MEYPGAFGAWWTVIDAVDVGHQDGEVSSDLDGDPGGQARDSDEMLSRFEIKFLFH